MLQAVHSDHRVFAELRILLVCSADEPELTRSLARDGHDVLVVDGEARARRLLRVFGPDVVLLYPAEEATVQRVRSESPGVTLVAIVADDVPEQRVAALDAGADDCVSEPFHHAELRARIRGAVRARGPRRRRSPQTA